ncbi:MAG: sigma-54-dependent Fis family transcriptional regulator [Acidobacteria bacterium]|nr:sigma-54-dependent Fis family transcriptional regulator [Acidobacteriota bacterium]MBI3663024.1 sigma-54-dependent Fis family transcriptional regulator [Acidobacteriota bacterium]
MIATETIQPLVREEHARTYSICVLDDDHAMLSVLLGYVNRAGHEAVGTTEPEEALEQIRAGRCRVVLSDMKMPGMNGLEFLAKALEADPGVYVILVTGYYSLDSAIEAIKRGAYDYLTKPLDFPRLQKTLGELAGLLDRRRRVRELEEQLLTNSEFHGIIGKSPAMLEVFDLVRKVAKHFSNVLIAGPTGAGKELVAKALHQISPVAHQKFAVCNCAAVVDTLLESQLFGHVRGAFTGANETRVGLFEYANGGTVFLDEVSEMALPMQAKLLRVIQNREIQRVGSPEVKRVEVRLIAATNRDLRAEVLAGRFREDLYYRLSTIQIRVPGLNERPEDMPLLAQYFLKQSNAAYGKQVQGLTRRAQAVLLRHGWPGNVRELENVISSGCLLAAADFIDVSDLPEHLQKPAASGSNGQGETNWQPLPLEEVRKRHIERVLELCGGNRVRAAEILGIGRTSLYRFLKRSGKDGHARNAA